MNRQNNRQNDWGLYPTRLVDVPVNRCTDAPKRLGKKITQNGVQKVPVVFRPQGRRIATIVIPKGFVGLVNRFGEYVGQWGAGFKFAPPWVSISHLVPQQFIVYDTPVKECPTMDNVMVTIDITLVLRIRTEDEKATYNFCYRLGPRGLDDHLKAFQEEAIRGMVRTRKYNEIYDLINAHQDKQFDKLKRELNDHFDQFGVTITDISVKNVHLPHAFADNMQEATVWHSKNEFETLKQEHEIRKIECRESLQKSKQKAFEDLDEFEAEQERELAELKREKQLVLAETSKQLAQIKEQEDADTLEIKANGSLVVAKLNKQKEIQQSKIRSTGKAQADQIRIESETYIQTKKADAEAEIAINTAVCLELEADAEGYAQELLAEKRLYEQRMRSLQMLRGLSHNDNVVVSGHSKDNVTAQLVANQKGG
eukprot:182438_1